MAEEDWRMNPFYDNHRQNQQQGFGQNFDLNAALQNLARQLAPTGMSAEQIVRQKIQNGEMSQEQFNQFASIADRLTGRKR
jgi:hypothetical protein